MDLILFWVFFYSMDIVQSLSAIKTKLYSTRMDYTVEGKAISDVKKVRSKIECAVVCERDADCLTFSYEASSKLCYMSSQVNNANREYGPAKRCPSSLGYNLIKYREVEICMKRIFTKVTQPEAKTVCSADDAHLLSIESKNMSDFVRNYLDSRNSLSVWLDGEDTTGDDKLLSWKGVEIPYVEWAEFQPDGGKEDCILSSSIHDYYVKDMECTIDTREYICQIGDGLH